MEFIEEHEVGYTARSLDELSIRERMKIEETTVKRILGAILMYCVLMVLFGTFL